MKTILLPTDFTESSNEIIAFALEAFNDEPCVFYFILTYSYKVHGLDALSVLHEGDAFFEEADTVPLKKMAKQISYFASQKTYCKHKFKMLCKPSTFIEGVKEAAEQFNADIILVGTKGKKPNTNKYLEKNINKMMTTINSCPIMAVPLNGKAWTCSGLDEIKLAS
jgi:hypothetical protein